MTPQERHNAACNITGEGFWGFQTAMVMPATVLTLLLTRLGASTTAIGLIPSLDGLALLLPMTGIYLFRSHKKRKTRIVMFHFLTMVPLLAAMGCLVLAHNLIPREILRVLLIGFWALFVASIGMVSAAWVDWIAHLFRREIRGTITGLGWGTSSLAGIAGALASGWALRNNEINTFGWLYLAAAFLAAVSAMIFLMIRDPARDMAVDYAPGLGDLLAAARSSLSDPAFRAILVGRSLSVAGFCIGPFIALHYLSPHGGALAGSVIVSLGAAQTAGSAVACVFFGRIGDRIGHRFGMLMGIVFQIACLLSVLLVPGPVGYFLAMLFAGCVGGTLLISYMNLVVESCPHEVRSAHVMIGSMVVGVAGVLFPLAGARLAAWAGIPALMQASLAISILAMLWTLWKIKDPRLPKSSPVASPGLT